MNNDPHSDHLPDIQTPSPTWPNRRREQIKMLIAVGAFFYISYGGAAFLAAGRHLPAVNQPWETAIPFLPWTILPYWSLNLLYATAFFITTSRGQLRQHAKRLVTTQIIAVAFFVLTPLVYAFDSPSISHLNGPIRWLFEALRGFDQPVNQAPSLHIALCLVVGDLYHVRIGQSRWSQQQQRLLGLLLWGWMALIALSVLTTYQHHFFDIPTGLILGAFAVWIWPISSRTSAVTGWRISSPPGSGRLFYFYSSAAVGSVLLAFLGPWTQYAPSWVLLYIGCALFIQACIYGYGSASDWRCERSGQWHWPTRWLLLPYRIGARLNQMYWLFVKKHTSHASEIMPNVFIGVCPMHVGHWPWLFGRFDVRFLSNQIPTDAHVINLAGELVFLPKKNGAIPVKHWATLDLCPVPQEQLLDAAKALDLIHAQNKTIYISCALGLQRSAQLLIYWLVSRGHINTVGEALRFIQSKRPEVNLGGAALAELEGHLLSVTH